MADLYAIEEVAKAEDLVSLAKTSGIHAAKQASTLIPPCRPHALDDVEVRIVLATEIDISAATSVVSRTGVEIEALTACGAAGLTMVMALLPFDPRATLTALALWHKSGGRSGSWER